MNEINLEEARDAFWQWIGERLDRKRQECATHPGARWESEIKTEITETEVVCDRIAKLFGYPFGR